MVFQGIEKMKYITYITLVSRLIFLGLIFVFIHSPSDYLFIPIINGIGAFFSGAFAIYIVFKKHMITFRLQTLSTLKYYFVDSVPIFVSSITSRLYVSTNKVIVGAFLTLSDVAYYDLAEKIVNVLKIPQQLIGQTVFPKLSKSKDVRFLAKKIFILSFAINLFFMIVILLLGPQMILFLGGEDMLLAKNPLYILAITLPVFTIGNIFGVQILIPFGYKKSFTKVIVASGIFYIVQLMVLFTINKLSIVNISFIVVFAESLVSAGMFYFCRKFKII